MVALFAQADETGRTGLSSLEADWLVQAGGGPTAKCIGQEITWARELAARIAKVPGRPDLAAELKQLNNLEGRLSDNAAQAKPLELYLAVRRVKRAIAFKNPAVDFSQILLVDNPYPQDRHESGHRHGYRAGKGTGRLLVLDGLTPDSPVRSLVPEEKAGFLWRPDLSFDAKKVVFCLMPAGERSFHLYEVNVDGTGFCQLMFGDYDDLDPIYLPGGKLMFTTTRAHTYVRCGPSHHAPVLARCDADGRNIMDLCGNRELIYTGKANVWHAMPMRPRPVPRALPDQVAWPEIGPDQPPLPDGVFFSADVFEGAPLLPKDRIRYLRVLQIDAKTYTPWRKTYQHSGPSSSITQADGVKRILGTTPVEADGSVCFKAPPGRALHFQLLDEHYRCVQTMRSFTGVMPGETRGCVGCHEGRGSPPPYTGDGLAMRRGAAALTPPPWGADVSIGYERFVQPVLDRYCGKCHQGEGEARKKLDFTFRPSNVRDPVFPHLPPQFTEPYVTLVGGGNNWYQPVRKELISKHGLPVSISGCLIVEGYRERTAKALATLKPGTHMSSASLLIRRAMDANHIGAKMDADSLRRLIAWVDTNGTYLGEQEIRRMPDPVHKPQFRHPYNAGYGLPMPVVRPRLRTAPRINRFNLRQDGDSDRVRLTEPTRPPR